MPLSKKEDVIVLVMLRISPKNATEKALGRQEYIGLCRPRTQEELTDLELIASEVRPGSMSAKITLGEILVAIPEGYTGKAYCQFIYNFINSDGDVEAQITAEGPIQMSMFGYSSLPITGGTEMFRRAVGTVNLYPATMSADDPPVVEWDPTLDLPTSFLMEVMFWLDESLVPPELME